MGIGKPRPKPSTKLRALFWLLALFVYGTGLCIFLTASAPQLLESMRKVGVWEGLGVAAFMYCVLLLLPPLLIKMKFRKGRFGQLTLAWSFLALCATAFLAPVSGWMNDRGSFVPALVWGPESAVVQQVVVEKLEWGEGWKKRPV